MRSGKRPATQLASLLLVALVLPVATGRAGEWDLSRLMALLGASSHKTVWFDEEKRIGVLDVPLDQSGTLEYRGPGYLNKHVEVPEDQSFEIDGDRVRLVQPGRPTREMGLDELPVLRAFAEGLRALLAGNLGVLEQHYRLALAGEEQGWTLALKPLDGELAALIKGIEFSGRGGRVERITINESGGDSSVMRLRPLR
jgi:hypothetical protein